MTTLMLSEGHLSNGKSARLLRSPAVRLLKVWIVYCWVQFINPFTFQFIWTMVCPCAYFIYVYLNLSLWFLSTEAMVAYSHKLAPIRNFNGYYCPAFFTSLLCYCFERRMTIFLVPSSLLPLHSRHFGVQKNKQSIWETNNQVVSIVTKTESSWSDFFSIES